MKRLFPFFFLMLLPIATSAYAVEIDGISYNLGLKTAEVTKSSGSSYSGVVVIPSEVTYNNVTYSVTSIGNEAFRCCESLTSVTIPNSVISIGNMAFAECNKLTSIVNSDNVTFIGNGAFSGTAWLNNQPSGFLYIGKVLYKYNGKIPENSEVQIKEGTTEIGHYAFSGDSDCRGMKSVTIPKSVTFIGMNAFGGCTGLNSVYISDIAAWCNIEYYDSHSWSSDEDNYYPYSNPLYYAKHLFLNGNEVTDLIIPEGVTSINSYTFIGCASITSAKISDGVKYIGDFAFRGCTNLASVTIPSSVSSIGDAAFKSCTGLEAVHISDIAAWCNIAFRLSPLYQNYRDSNPLSNAHHLYLNGKEITNLVIPDGITSINNYTFYMCEGLTSVDIANSVTKIGDKAFFYCTNLASINIPPSVTSIGSDAFAGTSWFENFHGLMYLGSIAYKYIGDMPDNTDIVIREGTTEINDEAFKTCYNLRSIIIPNSVTKIGRYAFWYSGLTSLTIGNGVTEIGYAAFMSSNINTINISDLDAWYKIISSYRGISNSYRLYLDGEEVTEISIPEGFTSDNGLCSGCLSLTSVTIPNSVTTISNNAFRNCSGLISVNIPNSVTSIGEEAFYGCTNLISVTIPNSVKTIGRFAFNGCSKLASVTIPDGITSIGDATFGGCTSLTTVIIPNSVTYIGNAFRESGLRSIWLGEKISSISSTAFYRCDDLQEIIITSDKFPNYKPMTYKDGKTYKESGWQYVDEMNCWFIIPHSIYEEGVPSYVKNFSTYNNTPMKVDIKEINATSAVLELRPYEDILNNADDITTTTVTTLGQTPGGYIQWKLDEENFGILSEKAKESLTLEVLAAKPLSTVKARLLAKVEEADDLTHYGFEWKRYDAPEDYPANKVSAPLYNGQIVGTLNKLKDDVYYKYRPFYESDAGEMFYGGWMTFFTGDADVYFEPEVYTKDAADITKVSALLTGVWFEGTDDFQEKGFEYWIVSGSKTRAVGADVKTVVVTGNKMTAILDGLQAGKEYGFRSYAKTASGTTYGEEKTFRTILVGDVNSDGELDKNDLNDLADYIMGKTPTSFDKNAADLNGDDKVNAADIVKLVDLLGK